MRKELFRRNRGVEKNTHIDATIDAYDQTIDKHIDEDVYSTLYPILSKSETKKDNVYFKGNRISPNDNLNSEELKTISYLAPFFKEKTKYNIRDIVKYLYFLGYNEVEDEDVFVLVINKDETSISEERCKAFINGTRVGIPYLGVSATLDDYVEFKQEKVLRCKEGIVLVTKGKAKEVAFKEGTTLDGSYIDGFDKNNTIVRLK